MKKVFSFVFLIGLYYPFFVEAQTKNYKIYYEVIDMNTGNVMRSSTIIITISGSPTYESIIQIVASRLGFKLEDGRLGLRSIYEGLYMLYGRLAREGTVTQYDEVPQQLLIKDYEVFE
jgi:hypothetical protein